MVKQGTQKVKKSYVVGSSPTEGNNTLYGEKDITKDS